MPTPTSAPTSASPKPTQSAICVPTSGLLPTFAAKYTKIGAIMNAATARNSSTIANTRCRLADGSEKPATNSAGATVAPSPMPVRPEPSRVAAWLEGTWIGEDQDPGGQEDHADERQVVHLALRDHEAEHDRRDHRSGDLGQVEHADAQRAVVAGQRRGREDGGRHRRGRGEQRDRDPGDGDRAREHRANRQERSLGAVLVDDEHDDRRQAAEQRHDHDRDRGSGGS